MTGQGTQRRCGSNALPHPHLPHDQPHPSRPTGTPASSPTASDLPTFTNLHATHGYITLPGPTRRPDLASAPLMRSKRRPPHPKHPKFAQFHRSGLHFGRIHPQHRQCGDSSKAYGDCHSVRGRQSLAGHRKRRTEPHVNNLPHRSGGHRRARTGFEARHRAKRGRLASRAAGPSGARNTRGA